MTRKYREDKSDFNTVWAGPLQLGSWWSEYHPCPGTGRHPFSWEMLWLERERSESPSCTCCSSKYSIYQSTPWSGLRFPSPSKSQKHHEQQSSMALRLGVMRADRSSARKGQRGQMMSLFWDLELNHNQWQSTYQMLKKQKRHTVGDARQVSSTVTSSGLHSDFPALQT